TASPASGPVLSRERAGNRHRSTAAEPSRGRPRNRGRGRRLQRIHIDVLEHQIELVPKDVRARMLLANTYAFFGNENESAQQLERAVAIAPAVPHGLLEMKAESLAMLKRATETGFSDIEWVSRDPDLSCLDGESWNSSVSSRARR